MKRRPWLRVIALIIMVATTLLLVVACSNRSKKPQVSATGWDLVGMDEDGHTEVCIVLVEDPSAELGARHGEIHRTLPHEYGAEGWCLVCGYKPAD